MPLWLRAFGITPEEWRNRLEAFSDGVMAIAITLQPTVRNAARR
jgi:hypothetical protein